LRKAKASLVFSDDERFAVVAIIAAIVVIWNSMAGLLAD
jgi:hypothetical protein